MVFIAQNITDDFIDMCFGLQTGDKLFARHPYKFFPLLEGKSMGSTYFVELKYLTVADLSKYNNNKRCQRVQNKDGVLTDTNIGSTVGGDFGYGYATNAVNNANQ